METQTRRLAPGAEGKQAAAVWLELPPSSVYNCGWTQSFCGRDLWVHCVSQLRDSIAAPLVVVGPPGSALLKEACERLGFEFFQGTSINQVPCLLELAANYDVSSLVVVHGLVGIGFTPAALPGDAARVHRTSLADVTIVVDLPHPLSVAVLGRQFLDLLQELPPQVRLGDDIGVLVETLAGTVGQEPSHGGIAVQRLPLMASFAYPPALMPSYIPWTYRGDVQRLEMVLGEGLASDAAAALVRLRKVITNDLDNAHRARPATSRAGGEFRRILFASNPSAYSGAEESLVNTLLALKGSGLELHCLIGQEGLFANRARAAGATVYTPNRDCAPPRVDTLMMLDELIERIRPDLIHSNGAIGFPLLAISRMRGIPLVQWARIADLAGVIDHLLSADRITAVSSFIAGEIAKQMVRPDKVRVLHDCVDTERFSPATEPYRNIRAELGVTPGQFMILCIARFVPYKRHDVLIHATALAAERHPNVRLVLIGDPQLGAQSYQQTLSAIAQAGLSARTTLAGFQHDVLSFEAAADAVVLCSEREPLGTVVLESMALGKPVIVAASGGLVEMIEDEVSGLHCKPGDPGSLSRQLCRLIESRETCESLGRQARKSAVERFSMDRHARELTSIYAELALTFQHRSEADPR